MKDYELNYIQSKSILDHIISAPSQNPALYMSSIQAYFDIDLDQEFMRKCRQDKYLFLSQLNQSPMVLNNVTSVNIKCHSYYTLKEFSYFMLANQIYKSQKEQKKNE